MNQTLNEQQLTGIAASSGIGIGNAVWLKKDQIEILKKTISLDEVTEELSRFDHAVGIAKKQIQEFRAKAAITIGESEAQIFDAHLSFFDDPAYIGEMQQLIQLNLYSAEAACQHVTNEMSKMLAALPDEYLSARSADLQDVGNRLLSILQNAFIGKDTSIQAGCVIIADELTPSEAVRLPKDVCGIITKHGSRTGHAAIMARSLGIPAIVGMGEVIHEIHQGDTLALDGDSGVAILRPNGAMLQQMRIKADAQHMAYQAAKEQTKQNAITIDGIRIQVFANIGNLQDIYSAIEGGAEGIGLFRTEFLYVENDHWPTEEEQFEVYSQVVSQFGDKPVIIRTLDIGGDKQLPYANLPNEENPFLGLRAIRFCLANKDILKVQLKALLRASVYGNLWIMFPMIADINELLQAKSILEECRQQLREQGTDISSDMKIGIMVETPAAAITADILAAKVDFMSIGTNDLTQYTLAADRGNESVAYLYQSHHPSVLRLIELVCLAGKRANIPVGVCGEFAGDPNFTQILIGLGVSELSMASRSIWKVKQKIQTLDSVQSQKLTHQALCQKDALAVKKILNID